MLRRSLPAVLVLAVAVTGCKADFAQNDDVEPQEADVRAGLVELYTLDDETPDVVAEGGCFADALLARLSLDELVQAGVVEDDGSVTVAIPMLDVDVAESWVDAQAACVDYVVPSTRALVDHGAVGLDETAYAACFEAALTDEQVRTALVKSLSGGIDGPDVAALTTAEADCAEQSAR